MTPDSMPTDSSALMKKALLELKELRTKLSQRERAESEGIAIIGMGCRFPGGANSPADYWQLLQEGRDAIREVPQDRWNLEDYYDCDPNVPGKMYTRSGGFIDRVDGFDPLFFGISPREAKVMDPQQRLLLEVCWEALEQVGLVPAHLKRSQTGVFVGLCTDDYALMTVHQGDPSRPSLDAYSNLGVTRSIAVGRIAHVLGLNGPNIAIDTACSSSLVAVHLACQSLRNQESNLALAGGVNLMLSPASTIGLCRLKALSPDGRCKTFDAAANGMARGEGCGVVVLKRLSDAITDGDRILAVIRGSAVNHDGSSSGLTVPNEFAQAALMQKALENAKLSAETISYIEAHGTGTALGDPIELEALASVYGQNRSPQHPLIVGSVKTNLGHLEAAAGIAGLIKVVLALQHQEIPPHLHFHQPNPHVNWDALPVVVPTHSYAWRAAQTPRRAGISSFGLSGTNAHLIVEEAPPETAVSPALEHPLHLLVLSAKSFDALEQLIERYQLFLQTHSNLSLATLCFSANTRRSRFEYQCCFIAQDLQQLQQQFSHWQDEKTTGVFWEKRQQTGVSKIAFLFTGQGSQVAEMGKELYQTQLIFRETLNRCAEILQPLLGLSLLDILYPKTPEEYALIHETRYTQPAIFALEYALFKVWESWGVQPHWVMGHSVGEYVAATVAGVFSLEAGLTLIAHRGRLMQELSQTGAMFAVFADVETVRSAISSESTAVAIAAINGPKNIVISGEIEALERIVTGLELQGLKTVQLKVNRGFHSPLVTPLLTEFREIAQKRINYRSPTMKLVSTVTGDEIKDDIATPEYWCQQIQKTVQFAKAVKTLEKQEIEVFVEIGSKPILLEMARESVQNSQLVYLPSLRPGKSDWLQMLESFAQLLLKGISIKGSGFYQGYAQKSIDLPTYPWQRKRYWAVESSQHRESLFSTEITQLLNEGNREQLTKIVLESGRFSAEKTGDILGVIEVLIQAYQNPLNLQDVPTDFLLSPTELKNQLQPQLDAFMEDESLEIYWQVLNDLEGLTADYLIAAFYKMGWQFPIGKSFSTLDIATQLGIVDKHHKLLIRLLEMLAEIQVIKKVNQDWQVVEKPNKPNPENLHQTLIEKCPQARAELTVVERCGSHLVPVLKGECDPLQSLFPAADVTLATELYQNAPFSRVMNTLIQKTLLSALEKVPPTKLIRILEIGAGTGGTTAYLLPHLNPQTTEYVFTDISPLFTTKASQKFQNYPFVLYQVLNLEKGPFEQNFLKSHYHIIIAANVVHATANLRRSLAHLHQMLAPEGLLILLETTAKQRWIDLFAGFTGGWWKFTDFDLRPNHPLISAETWEFLLKETGFETTATLKPSLKNQPVTAQPAIILAQSPQGEVELNQLPLKPNSSLKKSAKIETVSIREQLTTVSPGEGKMMLISYLQEQLRLVLGLELNELPQPQQGFFEIGLDSLTAVELKNRLEVDLKAELPATLAFDCPNIQALSEYIAQTVLGWLGGDQPDNSLQSDPPQEMMQFSEDELDALIEQEVAEIEQFLKDK